MYNFSTFFEKLFLLITKIITHKIERLWVPKDVKYNSGFLLSFIF